MKYCRICNIEFSDAAVYCPKCGSKLELINETHDATGDTRNEKNIEQSKNESRIKPQEKMHVKAMISLSLILLIILIGAIYIFYPRKLLINNGNDIVAYVDNTAEAISLYGNGLSEADYDNAEWYLNDDAVKITIKDGSITPAYDEDALVDHDQDSSTEYNSEDGEFSYRTTVSATIKKGLKKWKGAATVIVKLKEEKLINEKIIKSSTASADSNIKVTAGDRNAYIYLKSNTATYNDIAFTVKKNKTASVGVPLDKYTLYVAQGDVWYGSKYLFGPGTSMSKDNEPMDFSAYTYTYKLQAENGNVQSDTVKSSDFPR